MDIADYRDLVVLSTAARTDVYRGLDPRLGISVVIKALRPEYIVPEAIARIRYEYDIASSVSHACIGKPLRLLEQSGQLAIVFEDIGGQSLREHMAARSLTLKDCLSIGRQVALALTCLHENNIVHRDITPQNIVFNPSTGRAQLIDLGIASRLQRERASVDATDLFEGTLPFVSPEQTGRLSRSVDARSDLYSLGCTLYSLLTGNVPFAMQDPLELVHAILARVPAAPRAVNPSVPQVLSDIVMLLISKSPEGRYQSAAGLLADLEVVSNTLDADSHVPPFALRSRDFDETFKLPELLFGRDDEVSTLFACFDGMVQSGDNSLVLVRGNSGEGKTALVFEMQRALVQHRALYGAGKFDPLSRDIPYSAFNHAFGALLRQMLTRGSQEIGEMRERLVGALGRAGGVITSVLPAFEMLLGPQPPFHQLGPKESENRFLVMFREAIQAMAIPLHPLVLFLDDLQWADPQSMELIRILATPGHTSYVLLLGAYRPTEVDSNHALAAVLSDLRGSGARIREMDLGPLRTEDIATMVGMTLLCSRDAAMPLAALLAEKTAGNAFFLGELLRHMQETGCIRYSRSEQRWTWDMAKVQAIKVTDNVVDLMLRRLREAPSEAQQVLACAACCGSSFSLGLLATAAQSAPHEVVKQLWPAIQSGLVQPLDENYRYAAETSAVGLTPTAHYKFAHDKIRQAAEELVPLPERIRMRYTLGTLLMRGLDQEQLEARLFDVANHLHSGAALLTKADSPKARAVLLAAGQRAKRANACAAALNYLKAGEKLFPDDAWETEYRLYHETQIDIAECEDLTGDVEAARKRIDTALQRCKDPLDRLDVYVRFIALVASQNQLDRAIALGLTALAEVGVLLPAKPTTLQVIAAVLAVGRARAGRPLKSFGEMATLDDPLQQAILSVLVAICEPAFQVEPNLFIVLAMRSARITMQHGISRWASLGFSTYGIVLASALDKPSEAAEAGELALRMVERFGAASRPGLTMMTVGGLLSHYGQSALMAATARAEGAYRAGIETGELDASFRSACMVVAFQLVDGRPLLGILGRAEDFAQTFRLRGDLISREVLGEYTQAIRCLLGRTHGISSFSDADYDEGRHVEVMRGMQAQAPLADYHSLKMQVLLIMGDLRAAEEHGTQKVDFEGGLRGIPMLQQYYFILALVTSELLLRYPSERRRERRSRLRKVQRKLRWWGQAAPANFAADVALVDAQVAQIRGHAQAAHSLYEAALQSYEQAGRLNKEAIAHELWGRMCQRLSMTHLAEYCMRNARAAYHDWNASGKALALEEEFPHWLKAANRRERVTQTHQTRTSTQSTTGSSRAVGIDMSAVLNALQVLSAETAAHRLVHSLLRNLTTYVGGERTVLVMPREQELMLMAEIDTAGSTHDDQPLSTPTPIDDSAVPVSLLRYAYHTRQPLVIDDASADSSYVNQAYFQMHPMKAVLCVPLLHQGHVKAIVYAENSLVAYAFNESRVATCRMLGMQTLISFENSMLYTLLEDKVEQRTHELRDAQQRLVRLEKDATEQQMAGGFAHEMRNTLSAAYNALASAMGENAGDPGLGGELASLFTAAIAGIEKPGSLDAIDVAGLKKALAEVSATLTDIMQLTQESVQRALEVTSMIMEYSRLGLTRRGVDAVDVREVIKRIADEVRPEMASAQIRWSADLQTTQVFYGSEAHFYSVIRNLVNNARDALAACDDERHRSIDLHLERDGNSLCLRVSDNADGMSDQTLKRIFEPFFTTKLETGLGLGLSMVRKLVELYGGRIEVKSTLGKGTEFSVTYPVNQ